MVRKIFLFVWCCCCLMVSAQEIRFMSYNVRNAKGMDDRTDFDRVARVIKEACPDVVAVQEIDSVTRRSNGLFVLEEIGHRTGYSCSYATAIDYQGGKYGIGILFKNMEFFGDQVLYGVDVFLGYFASFRNLNLRLAGAHVGPFARNAHIKLFYAGIGLKLSGRY